MQRYFPRINRPVALIMSAIVAFGIALCTIEWGDRWKSVCANAFSPDGRWIAAGAYCGRFANEDGHWCISDLRQTVVLFDSVTGSSHLILDEFHQQRAMWGLPSTPRGRFLSFSPEGDFLAIGTWDAKVKLWDPRTRRLINVLQTQSPRIRAVAYSPDGRTLAAGSRNLLTLWNASAGYMEGQQIETTAWVRSVAFSSDSELVASGTDLSLHGLELRGVKDGRLERRIPTVGNSILALCFAQNGRYLAVSDHKAVQLWDLKENRLRFDFDAPWTADVAIAPDSSIIAIAGDRGLRFRRSENGDELGGISSQGPISSVAYSPSGKLIAVGDESGYLTVWDVGTNRKLWAASVLPAWRAYAAPAMSGTLGLILLFLAIVTGQKRGDNRYS